MQITRRRMLTVAGIASASAIGGCLGEGVDPGAGNGNGDADGNGDHDDNDTDDGNETGTGNDSNDTENDSNDTEDGNGDDANSGDGDDDAEDGSSDDGSESAEVGDEVSGYETIHYEGKGGETTAVPFSSREEAESYLEVESRQDAERSAIVDLLQATDFETDSLVALETQGNDGCSELQLKSLEVTAESGLSMTAAVVDASGEDEVCTQQITNLGLLVRVSYDGEAPSSGKATITDGQGGQHGVGWSSASDSTEGGSNESTNEDE
ncbi:hypothetical protein [Natronosalvus halobius]|uniref:hypothetical protein n=1 Tax=Natronosalvus halobius TaxID=2953746 RepID=UPI00209EBB0E|nr:hypothetical protein [Natronosalvus halobius]USZ73000.1 hypothetical protein NGM15_06775 [Natronosalvus halobius]